MCTIHDKIYGSVSHLIGIAQFNNNESSMKNTAKGLEFMYKSRGIDHEYLSIVSKFIDYIKNYKIYISDHIELYKLKKYLSVAKNPPKTFPIGSYVKHTRIGYKNNSQSLIPDNVMYDYGHIDDYDHSVNQYQIKYNNGRIVGWIEEKNIEIV